jgi:hypothetical protein
MGMGVVNLYECVACSFLRIVVGWLSYGRSIQQEEESRFFFSEIEMRTLDMFHCVLRM